jgi:hypothetical protein
VEPRTIQCHFFLARAELKHLDVVAKRSGLTRSAYLRKLISGVVPADRPPPDYFQMMRELHSIGNNLNQIAHHAHATGIVDEARYDRNVASLDEAIRHISVEVTSAKKRG